MKSLIVTDQNIMHGQPCFAGTRVTVQTLFDHLREGYTIDAFLEEFPTVDRETVMELLNDLRTKAEESAVVVRT